MFSQVYVSEESNPLPSVTTIKNLKSVGWGTIINITLEIPIFHIKSIEDKFVREKRQSRPVSKIYN